MKKLLSKTPTFLLGLAVGVALTAGSVAGAATYLKASINNVKIIVDGKEAKLSDKPLSVNGRTYLPVRDTANALGYSVQSVTSSAITLKEGISEKVVTSEPKSETVTSKSAKTVENLRETYSTDGKLDPTKIREALNSGALDVNAKDEDTGNTLLMYVILDNNYEAYKAIKHNVLNADVQNNEGKTALHLSVINKNVFYFGELTGDLKADATIKDISGKQAIDYAAKGSAEQIELKIYMM